MQSQPICFQSTARLSGLVPVIPLGLMDHQVEALASLLPLLQCGEESASLAFGHLSRQVGDAERNALLRIADDECRHEILLAEISLGLPRLVVTPARKIIRHFYLRQQHDVLGAHFARIAALDSATCTILAALTSRHSALRNCEALHQRLTYIHRDETRHVVLSRDHAISRVGVAAAFHLAKTCRDDLAEMLETGTAAIEQLGIDPSALLRRVRQVPAGLFA